MNKSLVVAAILFASLMVTGFASREWRAVPLRQSAVGVPYEAHLNYYEEIRPSLLDRAMPLNTLCGAQRPEIAGRQ